MIELRGDVEGVSQNALWVLVWLALVKFIAKEIASEKLIIEKLVRWKNYSGSAGVQTGQAHSDGVGVWTS